jgi:CPA2 family monovalent cation:H+ antiporter-2
MAGLAQARCLVIVDDDPAMVERVASVARVTRPDLKILVRTYWDHEAGRLREIGADRIVSGERESLAALLEDVLADYGLDKISLDPQEPLPGGSPSSAAQFLITLNTDALRATHSCTHLDQVRTVRPRAEGCEECLRSGGRWVHLRICMTCGHIGCCDSSKNKHATLHHRETGHPIVKSFERGEDWAWCYPDQLLLEPRQQTVSEA